VVTESLGLLDHLDRLIEHAAAVDDKVVRLLHAVEMHVDAEALVRCAPLEEAIEQDAVGAEIDMALAGDDAVDEFGQLRVQRRLATANRDHRRPGVVDRLETLVER
jgi:hypothetical protein